MSVSFRTKFQVSGIILTSFRQERVIPLPPSQRNNNNEILKRPPRLRLKEGMGGSTNGLICSWEMLTVNWRSSVKVNKITMSSVLKKISFYGSIYLNVKFKRWVYQFEMANYCKTDFYLFQKLNMLSIFLVYKFKMWFSMLFMFRVYSSFGNYF